MARIRTIKPEICDSEQFAECSPRARLLFILSWLHFDDNGNHVAKPRQLGAECFPYDNVSRQDMESLVGELIRVGLMVEYRVPGSDSTYWHITGWHHQKIDHKSKPRCPEYDPKAVISSPNTRECSPSDHGGLASEGTSKGLEGTSKGIRTSASADVSAELKQSFTSTASAEASGFEFVIAGGKRWALPAATLKRYHETFPAMDVEAELRKAALWLESDVGHRKTATGMTRFLTNWLNRGNNSGKYQRNGVSIAKDFRI